MNKTKSEPDFSAIKPLNREEWISNIKFAKKDTLAKRCARDNALLILSGHEPKSMTAYYRKKILTAIKAGNLKSRIQKQSGVKRLHAARRIHAMPAWADRCAIDAIYAEARRISIETGIPHEVDHIEPLLGKNVSGLHVETNMRVITRTENRRKSNRI